MKNIPNIYKPGTQKYWIVNHLTVKKSITQVEAETVYKIRRLASRVSEMKADGYSVATDLKKDLMGQRYAKYVRLSFPIYPY